MSRGCHELDRAIPACRHPVVLLLAGTLALSHPASAIATATGRPGRAGSPISVSLYSYPTVLAVTGSTAVVLDTYASQVALVNTQTQQVFAPLTVGNFPVAVAISP
jgi:hypothetical protein